MKQLFKSIFLVAIISVLLVSCIKERDFPVEPSIEFKQYIAYGRDSADCIISFKDGDGDIGNNVTSDPDFILKYLYKDLTTGVFKPYDLDASTPTIMDTLFYNYRVPNITPDGQYKSLEGEIKAKLRSAPLYFPTHKIVKFEITLRDRAGHLSNRVTSNEIILP